MQPAAQAAGCFCCPADGELAHRTTDNENRQEVRRTDGCMIPKGLPGPPRAAPRCRKRSAAESRPQRSSVLPRIGAGVGGYWRRCGFSLGTCSAKQASVRSNGAGPHPFSAPAPKDHETCTTQSLHLRQRGCFCVISSRRYGEGRYILLVQHWNQRARRTDVCGNDVRV